MLQVYLNLMFVLSPLLWSSSMVEQLSASGGPESVSAYPPLLPFQTLGILWPYEGCENIECAMTELGHLSNSLDKPFTSSGLLWPPHVPAGKSKKMLCSYNPKGDMDQDYWY